MEKGKRIEAEFQLPEALIQHIQSFLNGKEATQTTILSKSWYAAWLTRPNLDFDRIDFDRNYFLRKSADETVNITLRFWDFVKKTMERYEKLNLKIDSLRLRIFGSYDANNYGYDLAKTLILKVLEMGATGLDLKIHNEYKGSFVLPHEVFGSENLIRLSVSRCRIDLGADGRVSCSKLKSFTLDEVYVEGDIILDIISSCPLIENLSLRISNKPAVSPFTKFGKRNVGSVVGSPFDKLKCLFLSGINVDALFFHDLSSKFPCLKDLTVRYCGGYKEIQISSSSLEFISFSHDRILRLEFDVPSIRKFTFSGNNNPLLSFKTTTTNWESDISIHYPRTPNARWFLKLNNLLTNLSLSKISLFLGMYNTKGFDCAKDIKGLSKPKVENLTIHGLHGGYTYCPELLDALFRCCRPIYVTQYWCYASCYSRIKNCNFMEVVYKSAMQEVSLKCSSASQSMSGECDLMGVDVEFFDKAISAWLPRLLDASTSPRADEQRIRLHLMWDASLQHLNDTSPYLCSFAYEIFSTYCYRPSSYFVFLLCPIVYSGVVVNVPNSSCG